MLPFNDALRLLGHLPVWLREGGGAASHHIELVARVAVLLLRLHHAQLIATPTARPALLALRAKLGPAVQVSSAHPLLVWCSALWIVVGVVAYMLQLGCAAVRSAAWLRVSLLRPARPSDSTLLLRIIPCLTL